MIGEASLLRKMLYANEYSLLTDAVQELAGVADFAELEEEVKNG